MPSAIHEGHDDPSLDIEEGERTAFICFLFDAACMFIVQFLKDKEEEQQKHNSSLSHFEKKITGHC